MNQYHDLLDEAIGTPPPPTFDLDGIIARQRRRARYLQLGAVGSAAAVTLTVAVVLGALPGGAPTPPIGPQTGGPAGATSAPPLTNEQRMGVELQRALTALLPRAQFVGNRPPGKPRPPFQFAPDDDGGVTASAEVRDASGAGSIAVSVSRGDPSAFADVAQVCGNGKPLDLDLFDCKTATGHDGSHALLISTARGAWKRHRVEVYRRDGTVVTIEVNNASALRDHGADVARRPAPPLTRNQARTLAENPVFRAS
jgi:hypothetical protein